MNLKANLKIYSYFLYLFLTVKELKNVKKCILNFLLSSIFIFHEV